MVLIDQNRKIMIRVTKNKYIKEIESMTMLDSQFFVYIENVPINL